jgi:hypothetical protein
MLPQRRWEWKQPFTTPDTIAVSNNAVDDEDITDEETVLTRGSNGPRPSKLLNQPIARDLTLKFCSNPLRKYRPAR